MTVLTGKIKIQNTNFTGHEEYKFIWYRYRAFYSTKKIHNIIRDTKNKNTGHFTEHKNKKYRTSYETRKIKIPYRIFDRPDTKNRNRAYTIFEIWTFLVVDILQDTINNSVFTGHRKI